MLFSDNESIEDRVVKILTQGSYSASEMYTLLSKVHPHPTLQALYKALRILFKNSVIVKNGKKITLSKEWTKKIIKSLKLATPVPPIDQNESVSYTFSSLSHLDSYWKHIMNALQEELYGYPVFMYNPFGIWIHLSDRYKSEVEYLNDFTKNKQYGYWILGNENHFDNALKKKFQSEYLQIATKQDTNRSYLTVIGPYTISVNFNRALDQKISKIFQSPNALSPEELQSAFRKPGRIRLKFEHDLNKAKKHRRLMSKHFYIPQSIKKKFDLF